MHVLVWTDDRVELLRKLVAEGLSCSQIAAEIGGITRNAVIGKMHRLGLEQPVHKQPQRRRARAKVRRDYVLPLGRPPKQFKPVEPAAEPPPPIVLSPGADRPVTMMELGQFDCRAVLDERNADNELLYCGHTCGLDWEGARSSYCTTHHELFHQPLTSPKRRLSRLSGMPR